MGQQTSSAERAPQIPSPASTPAASCPIQHSTTPAPSKCPIAHDQVNPQNQMPHLSQAPSPHQTIPLPTDRSISSIPRASTEEDAGLGRWEYPSPQQFYNALARKGWETPEEHIETMVDIHNHLNEEAWKEVLKWERRWMKGSSEHPQLERLQGRPGELSPKARLHLFAGWLFPSQFNSEPPFDRHDWIIRRPHNGESVRYVIDYYSAPPDVDGSPVFSLDVRPAIDSLGSIKERVQVATAEAWEAFKHKASPAT